MAQYTINGQPVTPSANGSIFGTTDDRFGDPQWVGPMGAPPSLGSMGSPGGGSNALASAMNFVNYNGQQVRNDDSYMQNLMSGAAGMNMTPQEYDKLINPDTYAARWGAATTPVTGNPLEGLQASAMQIPVYQSAPVPTYAPYQSEEFNFEADPSYAFRKQQGNDAIQKRQLASGNFFSGGALKEIDDYNSGLASQEYGNAFQRYLNKDATNFRNSQANFGNAMTGWTAADNAGFRNNGAAYDRGWNENQRDYNRWVDDYNRGTTADNTNWDRLTYLDKAGLSATGVGVNAGQNTSDNVSNLTSQAGNAQAGGYINSANAWTNALGNAIYTMRK